MCGRHFYFAGSGQLQCVSPLSEKQSNDLEMTVGKLTPNDLTEAALRTVCI